MPKWLESKFAAMKIGNTLLSRQFRNRDVYYSPYGLASNSRSGVVEEAMSATATLSEVERSSQERRANLNSNSLRCFQCHDELTSRIYQCAVGHLFCYDCKIIQQVCSSCTEEMRYDSDPRLPTSLKSTGIRCSHAGFGCDFKPHPLDLESHSKVCTYRPCPCPLQECLFEGPYDALWQHLYSFHCNSRETIVWTTHDEVFQIKKTIWMGINNQSVMLRCCSSSTEIKLLLHLEVKSLGVFFGVRCFTGIDKEKDLNIKISLKRNGAGKKGSVTYQGRPRSIEHGKGSNCSPLFHFRKRFLQLNSLGQFMILFELSMTNNKI